VGKKIGWLSWARMKKTDPTLIALSVGHGVTHWNPSILYIILPYLSKDLGRTYSQVGVLMGWNYFTSFFINLPGGLIVDMVGRTGFLLGLAIALTGLPYFFLGFSPSYGVARMVVTFVGIGNNIWHPTALSFLAKRYPDRKGYAIALHAVGAHLGDALAPIAVGVALTFLTWRHVLFLNFLFIGALAFLGFFLFSLGPVMVAWMMDLAPKNISGTNVSALFGIQSLFGGFSPALCGFIADRFGILYSFYFLAFTVFAANFLVYLIPDKLPKKEGVLVPQA
jgi:MFS transporter, FSR family, fosmidomycin resistance protein